MIRNKRIKKNFFKKQTKKSCYWAGYLLADGSISIDKRGYVAITVSSKDKNQIENLKKDLQLDVNISILKEKYFVLNFGGKQFLEDLKKFAVIPNKTYNYIEPIIPNNLFWAFLKGYFDGDGNWYIRNQKHSSFRLCGNKFLINWFRNKLIENNIKASIGELRSNRIWAKLRVTGIRNMYNLYKKLDTINLKLDRKWSDIKKLKKLYMNLKRKTN